MRALVVDDSGVIRCILSRALRGLGMQRIVEANDGEKAWNSFLAFRPNLVLTDWHMPGMDGLELTRKIREIDPNVPIILITIADTKNMIMQAISVGVSDYICKPFDRDELEAKLERFVADQPF